MPVKIGNDNISKLFLGNTPVTGAYLGDEKVYPNLDFFNPLVLYMMNRMGNQIRDEVGDRHATIITAGGKTAPEFTTTDPLGSNDGLGMIPNESTIKGGNFTPEELKNGYVFTVYFKVLEDSVVNPVHHTVGYLGIQETQPVAGFIINHRGLNNRTVFEAYNNPSGDPYGGSWSIGDNSYKLEKGKHYVFSIAYHGVNQSVRCYLNGKWIRNLSGGTYHHNTLNVNMFIPTLDEKGRNNMNKMKIYCSMVHNSPEMRDDYAIKALHYKIAEHYGHPHLFSMGARPVFSMKYKPGDRYRNVVDWNDPYSTYNISIDSSEGFPAITSTRNGYAYMWGASGSEFTAMAWIRKTGYNHSGTPGENVMRIGNSFILWYTNHNNPGPLQAMLLQSNGQWTHIPLPGTENMELNRWYHIAATCKNNTLKYFLNGTKIYEGIHSVFYFRESRIYIIGDGGNYSLTGNVYGAQYERDAWDESDITYIAQRPVGL